MITDIDTFLIDEVVLLGLDKHHSLVDNLKTMTHEDIRGAQETD